MEDGPETPPKDIDPYATLNLPPSASASDIKTAYKKLALRHHPDKAPPSEKPTAHSTFQRIAFAYAILSSPHRRTLYDTTGSTSETLAADNDDFNWLSFFRTQYSSLSASALNDFSMSYKFSKEERKDVLAAYTKYRGKMGKLYEEVMLSNPLEDETRFREIVDEAIKNGEVEAHGAYVNETKKSKEARMKKAKREAEDAEKEARANAKYQSIFGGDGKGGRPVNGEAAAVDEDINGIGGKSKKKSKNADYEGNGDISDLAAMIQSRNKARSDNFFDKLEAKYAGTSATGTRKRRKAGNEPDEEAFEKNRAKMAKGEPQRDKTREVNGEPAKGRKTKVATKDVGDAEEEEHEGDVDLQKETDGDEDESEPDDAEEGSEEKKVEPKQKAQRGKSKKATPPGAKQKTRARGRARK